jgi:hypothetical protein
MPWPIIIREHTVINASWPKPKNKELGSKYSLSQQVRRFLREYLIDEINIMPIRLSIKLLRHDYKEALEYSKAIPS